ncbi:YrdB family protein [Klugiella xanthotipulae]|uniref:YrdB family protein n=1 Tax=Klugiella xanthotipulae TaxID=244735 RepID=UPI00147727C4|nr:YrdB family protein [Klugiella xanthotipulae]
MTDSATAPKIDTLTLCRAVMHLVLFVCVGAWGFLAWEMPWPGIATGIGSILVAILMWAAFLSPRPMLGVDAFARGLVELLLIAAAVVGLIAINAPPWLAIVVGLLTATTGFLAGRRSLS